MSIPVASRVTRSLAAPGGYAGVIPDVTLGVARDAAALRGRAIVSVTWEAWGPARDCVDPEPPASRPGDGAPGADAPQLTVLLGVRPSGAGAVRAVLKVSGEIDISTVTPLRAAALAVCAAAHPRPGQAVLLVVDLEGVTFLDSRALHFLHEICVKGVERGWALELKVPHAEGAHRVLCYASSQGWLPPDLVQHRTSAWSRSSDPVDLAMQGPATAA